MVEKQQIYPLVIEAIGPAESFGKRIFRLFFGRKFVMEFTQDKESGSWGFVQHGVRVETNLSSIRDAVEFYLRYEGYA
jgi:hypothetical protein